MFRRSIKLLKMHISMKSKTKKRILYYNYFKMKCYNTQISYNKQQLIRFLK